MKYPISKEDLRIVFMGTPEFAVESLKKLIEEKYNIVGVVTTPDKAIGRGHKIKSSSVKEFALKHNLHILQPTNLKCENFIESLNSLNIDILIVVAFRMLPKSVWSLPRMGTFNLHGSLLPNYRGAAPINWAIINGEKLTGVTTFFLNEEIDKGEIILNETELISDEDNVGSVYERLQKKGASLVIKTVELIRKGEAIGIRQEDVVKNSILLEAPKIYKETCEIDWDKKGKDIFNFIRGLSPYPAAWTNLRKDNGDQIIIKIYESKFALENHNLVIGTIISDNKKYLRIACKDGFIDVLKLQLPNKKVMEITSVLNGFKFGENDKFI